MEVRPAWIFGDARREREREGIRTLTHTHKRRNKREGRSSKRDADMAAITHKFCSHVHVFEIDPRRGSTLVLRRSSTFCHALLIPSTAQCALMRVSLDKHYGKLSKRGARKSGKKTSTYGLKEMHAWKNSGIFPFGCLRQLRVSRDTLSFLIFFFWKLIHLAPYNRNPP